MEQWRMHRLGFRNFWLYERLGKQMMPLSKQKLKNKLDDPENWAETPTAYKKLVNDRLYGFRNLRQFDQMVQLLIKVRAPKLSKDAFRPEELKQTKVQQEKRLESDQNGLNGLTDHISKLEVKLRDQGADLQDQKRVVESDRKELTSVNQLLQLEVHEELAPFEDIGPLRAALKTRKDLIHLGLRVIEERDRVREQLDFYAQALEEANRKQTIMENRLQEAQAQEWEERDRLIEDFARWQAGSRELRMEETDTAFFKQTLARYRVPSDWTVLQQRLNQRYQQSVSALEREKLALDAQREDLADKINKNKYDLDQIRNQPEPSPSRREQTEALRIQLTMRGIPYSAFYEAVDFAPELSPDDRDRLEAQLQDAGLLDSLLVPRDYLPELEPLLEEYPDRFLIPGEQVADPIRGLRPVPGTSVEQEAAWCLGAISRSDLAAKRDLNGAQAFLERPENADRAGRIRELEAELRCQADAERVAGEVCIRLRTLLQGLSQRIGELEEEVQSLAEEANLRENYFREDLALGLVEKIAGLENMDLPTLAAQAYGLIQPNDRERSVEQLGEALRGNLQKNNSALLSFQPKLAMHFDPAADGILRQRLLLTLCKDGKEMGLHAFLVTLDADIALTESVLEENDRRLFENILLETISQKLRGRIRDSQNWCQQMSQRMCALDTSMGMRFSLDWKPQKAETDQELDTAQLVSLLGKDHAILTQQDREKVSNHFRARVQSVRSLAVESDGNANYADLIRTVLDYQTWFEFRLYYQRDRDQKKELTNRVFSKFSGGEKAMAMYVPLFAAVSAQYQKANETCPKMIALDEAFAGVDDRNIGAMFALVGDLGFDYIMNSQALWGCYPNVRD